MNQPAQTAGPDDSVNEAAARMASNKIGCLPVTEAGKPIGLVTTTDVLAAEVRSHTEADSKPGPAVGDVMTTDPVTVHPDDHLLDAAARMHQQRVRHLPVIDGDRRVVGMLSDRDIRTVIGDPARALGEDTSVRDETLRVGDAMSEPVMTVSPETSCAVAARMFARVSAGAVAVVDDREQLIGIVSYIDLLRAFAA